MKLMQSQRRDLIAGCGVDDVEPRRGAMVSHLLVVIEQLEARGGHFLSLRDQIDTTAQDPATVAGCVSRFRLPSPARRGHASGMFAVSEADAAAIRDAFEHGGELAAAVELRRLFPGLANNENTRLCARSIASWQPPPVPPVKPRRIDRRRASRPAAA